MIPKMHQKISTNICLNIFIFLIVIANNSIASGDGGGGGGGGVQTVDDLKAFKKHMRTHVNVLAVFHASGKEEALLSTLEEVAQEVKGKASVLKINCASKEGKKLCKKYQVSQGMFEDVLIMV